MKPRVYIETTIPSYYFDERRSLAHDIARTREWWDKERSQFDCVTSQVVIDELSAEGYRNRDKALRLLREVPRLRVSGAVLDLAELYREQMLCHARLLPMRSIWLWCRGMVLMFS